ncbi:right-handed parallel beta-helix repeat-containing protein [Pseudarthrobacter sp. MM222]|uniref:right-handed parallel beta-helix repeat-containing protein n=1 Tax=Pseudarthrobacter sp. MM222 TaxID=3018929 RepID=UPI0022203605|nr:right-handed parallel beta-helix repeat-containing protein [Pseudarthrobacter sp. MM222]CAI3803253.1 hypothetical protein NKCBBBOE_03302 [Pseudarthrobacter sp. MM222]
MMDGKKPHARTAWLLVAAGLSVLLLGTAITTQLLSAPGRSAGTTGGAGQSSAVSPGQSSGQLAVPALSADGSPLNGSKRAAGTFTASVNAPGSATVKFKMDGTYLGQDSTAPYTWPVQTGPGTHKLEARWDAEGGSRVEATFEVLSGGAAAPSVSAPPTAAAPQPTAPASGAAGTVLVATSAELASALAAAKPGQIIQLRDGRYGGKFVAAAPGTAAAPITLTGSRAAVLSTGSIKSGYALHVTGSHWRVSGFSVTESAKGIVLDGSTHTVLSNLDVGRIGDEAVHFRANSADSAILDSDIHDTGLAQPGFGEGIYVGSANSNWRTVMGSASQPDRSDRVQIRNNRISRTSAEGIDIKEGSTGGFIVGNTFAEAGLSGANSADSWMDIKGNGYTVTGNSGTTAKLDALQVHSVLDGWGRDNKLSGNTVVGGVPGYEVWVQSAKLGNIVGCKGSAAGRGLTNVTCSP